MRVYRNKNNRSIKSSEQYTTGVKNFAVPYDLINLDSDMEQADFDRLVDFCNKYLSDSGVAAHVVATRHYENELNVFYDIDNLATTSHIDVNIAISDAVGEFFNSRNIRESGFQASTKARRTRYIKASSMSADIIPELLTGSADAYIQEWSKQYKGTPETSWDNIFDNVLFDFTLYAEDEASADEEGITFADGLELGLYTDDDIFTEFEQFVMFKDLEDYDVR